MQREIKFRAFSHREGKMFAALSAMHFDDGVWACSFMGNFGVETLVEARHLILMQFTGLLDKNGKEIFEGDIVAGIYFGIIKHHDQSSSFVLDIAQEGEGDQIYFFDTDFGERDIEVIGNIYENHELLGGTPKAPDLTPFSEVKNDSSD